MLQAHIWTCPMLKSDLAFTTSASTSACSMFLGDENWAQTFSSQTFQAPPKYPGKIRDIPPKKVWFPWFRGAHRTFWPPPLHVEDPHPTEKYPDSKVCYFACSQEFGEYFFRVCLGILHWKMAGTFGDFFLVSVSHETKHEKSSKHSGKIRGKIRETFVLQLSWPKKFQHQWFPEWSWRSFRRNWWRTSGEVSRKEIFEPLLLGKIVRNISTRTPPQISPSDFTTRFWVVAGPKSLGLGCSCVPEFLSMVRPTDKVYSHSKKAFSSKRGLFSR